MTKSKSEDNDLLKEAKDAFEDAQSAEGDNRASAIDDIRFARLLEQWPEDIAEKRRKSGRPCLTISKLTPFIRQVVNDARQNKPAIKVHPVDSGADIKTAEIIDGLIRNIEYASNADVAYDTAVECAVTGGFGYWRIGLDYAYDDAFDMDILIQRISNPFSVYGDPNSRAADSSDWDSAFITDRLTKAQYEREYRDADKVDWDDSAWTGLRNTDWLNDDGVLIAEWWTREHVDEEIMLFADVRTGKPLVLNKQSIEDEDNLALIQAGLLEFRQQRTAKTCKVKQRIMSGAEVLKTTDWLGRYIPIVPVYGDEFDVEGKRYFRSLIHNAKDAQRMFNYWRTTSTELVALAPRVPFIGPKGTFDSDIDRWNTANTESHPFLEYDDKGTAPQRQPLDGGTAAGALQEALNASDDMKAIIGMYDASLGARSNETSGKAIMARQREGDVATYHFQDNLQRAIRHTGRIMIDLIPKVYTGPRIIRVIGEDGSQSAHSVNQQAPMMDKKGQPVMDPATGQAIMAMHDLTTGKYDLTISTGPSFTTRREEAAMQMTEMIRAFPESAPVVGPQLAKNLDWPGADEIAEKLEKMTSGAIPPPVQKAIEEGKQQLQKLTQENQQLKLNQQADMAKLQSDRELGMVKLANEKELGLAKIANERDIQAMRMDGKETVGADGKKIIKSGSEQIMDGLAMLGQLIVRQQEATGMQLERLAQIMAAPNELVRDPKTGRAIGARKVVVPSTVQ